MKIKETFFFLKGTIRLRNWHFLGGRGQKFAKFADVLDGWSLKIKIFIFISYRLRNIFICILLQQRHLTVGLISNDFSLKDCSFWLVKKSMYQETESKTSRYMAFMSAEIPTNFLQNSRKIRSAQKSSKNNILHLGVSPNFTSEWCVAQSFIGI